MRFHPARVVRRTALLALALWLLYTAFFCSTSSLGRHHPLLAASSQAKPGIDSTDSSQAKPGTDSTDSSQAKPGIDSSQAKPGTDSTDSSQAKAGTDSTDSSQAKPGTDSSQAKPGIDSTDSSQAKPGTDSTDSSQAKPGTDSTDSSQAKPGTDSTDSSQAKPGIDSTDSSQAKPGIDSTDSSQAKPGTDSTDSSQAKPDIDSTDSSQAKPDIDSTDSSQAKPGIDSTDSSQAKPDIDSTDSSQAKPGTDSTDSSQATPGTDSSQAKPGTDSSQAKPGTDSSQATPGTDSSQATPGTDSSQATPGTDSSRAKPGIHSSQATPGTDSSQATPGTDSSRAKPGTDSSRAKPGIHSSRAKPGIHSSRAKPGIHSTDISELKAPLYRGAAGLTTGGRVGLASEGAGVQSVGGVSVSRLGREGWRGEEKTVPHLVALRGGVRSSPVGVQKTNDGDSGVLGVGAAASSIRGQQAPVLPSRGDEGGRDVSRDVSGQDDVDPFADVTYPPYVERLPPDAEGNGPEGKRVVKSRLSPEEQETFDDLYAKNQFNQLASDLIPVHRDLPDFRPSVCREMRYPSALPNTSVVIIFHNEAWSTLLRSVHSVLDRTPPHLLLEVILVDDFSSMEHLKRPLDKYFRQYPKVRVVRAPTREGLTRARLRGFEHTTGQVVIFLDSHVECTEGWAEPLLWMVSLDYKMVPFPTIDSISADQLQYVARHRSAFGVLHLSSFTFGWSGLLHRGQGSTPSTQPRPSPTMPGGLFAISRHWFTQLGKYDPDLLYWGGENIELSFKTWMCGGSVMIADCSHVGHIFRASNPIKWTHDFGPRNYVRVAMVWMDRYKGHYLERINYRVGDYGNITDRLEIRKRLQCHSFHWYIHNVYPELMDQIVLNATFAGEIRHVHSGMCLDKMQDHRRPQLYPCHRQGGSQFWYLREDRYLQTGGKYLCSYDFKRITWCSTRAEQRWAYNQTTGQLRHAPSGGCLQGSGQDGSAQLALCPCLDNFTIQHWAMERRQPFKYT